MSPFSWISETGQRGALLVLTALLVVLSIALSMIGAPLITSAAPRGIVSFEFAGTAETAARMLDSWSPRVREQAMLSLGLDYLYLGVYPAWLALACTRIARRGTPVLARIGRALAWAVLLAAPLDAVENGALIRSVASGASDAMARLAWICAAPKFALVFAGLLYVLVGVCALGLRRLRRVP